MLPPFSLTKVRQVDPALIGQLRSFNRTVTQSIGVLEDNYLGRSRPLAECRLLFEIGADGATVQSLRARLDLDSGYLSRLLRSLESQGLISIRPDPADRRVRIAELTKSGRLELEELDRLTDELAGSIIEPLTMSQRQRLGAAMAEAEALLLAASARIEEESPWHPEAQHCLELYYAELRARFEKGFDPNYESAPALGEFAPPRGSFLIIRVRGLPVGCGGLQPLGTDRAYLKRMWIAKARRGLGLGKRLLGALESKAAALNYRTVCLETNAALGEAQQLYRRSGYQEVEPFNDDPYANHWFEKPLSSRR